MPSAALPITDGAYGEPWVFRYKDLRSWWSNPHHDRMRWRPLGLATAWVPLSKPIRFTEFGCAAVDKGTNQPNKFIDAKSSESGLPAWSNGRRDDLIQMQYLLATSSTGPIRQNNPLSALYGGRWSTWATPMSGPGMRARFPSFPGRLQSGATAETMRAVTG